MEIVKVKDNGENGYIVNDTVYVPKVEDNRHYRMIIEWIDQGGVVEPQFTDEELIQLEQDYINQEAKSYLISTDWYIIRQQETGVKIPDDILQLREDARNRIK